MARERSVERRDGVELTNLDQPLGGGSVAGASPITKRQLVDYLDAFADRLVSSIARR